MTGFWSLWSESLEKAMNWAQAEVDPEAKASKGRARPKWIEVSPDQAIQVPHVKTESGEIIAMEYEAGAACKAANRLTMLAGLLCARGPVRVAEWAGQARKLWETLLAGPEHVQAKIQA
eukprot:9191642-Alexandrium_andersonii.AAC.1